MKVALVGYAIENQAALRHFRRQGVSDITICDQNAEVTVPTDVQSQLGDGYLDGLDRFDVVVRTPGIHPELILKKNPGLGDKLTTAVNLFFEACNKPIVGVTGTKGKGTTSTLITKLLDAAGKKAALAGNIGIPMLDLLPELARLDYVVLELSSFQLIDFKHAPAIAVCLMIVPEHLNWHVDMDDYLAAKQQLFNRQKSDDLAVFNRGNAHSTQVVAISPAHKVPYEVPGPGAQPVSHEGAYVAGDMVYMNGTPICKTADVALLGRHNLENVCAAVAATWEIILHNTDIVQKVVKSFAGLEHRLELVRELDGVRYFNDSFAATPDAAMAAIQAIKEPKVLLVGGFDRQLPLEGLAQTIVMNQASLRRVLLIGQSAERLKEHLEMAGYANYEICTATAMPDILAQARTFAQRGDAVLLSPGFASFDMFKNFEDRGLQFKAAVKDLK